MRILRFGAVGLLNTLIDFGVLNLFLFLFDPRGGVALAVGNAVAFAAANLNSYFFNRDWTFGDSGRDGMGHYPLFLLLSLGGVAVNTMVLLSLAGVFSGASGSAWTGVNLAKLFATGASLGWNYLAYRLWVFPCESKEQGV